MDAGSRFQKSGYQDQAKNVVGEHEDKDDRCTYYLGLDSYTNHVHLWRLQVHPLVNQIRICFYNILIFIIYAV